MKETDVTTVVDLHVSWIVAYLEDYDILIDLWQIKLAMAYLRHSSLHNGLI